MIIILITLIDVKLFFFAHILKTISLNIESNRMLNVYCLMEKNYHRICFKNELLISHMQLHKLFLYHYKLLYKYIFKNCFVTTLKLVKPSKFS